MAEVNPYLNDIHQGLSLYDFALLNGSTVLVTGANS